MLVRDEDEAIAIANQIAPEHLHVSTAEPQRLVPRLTNAGAIFLGHYAPVAAGDYAAGPSHVLPTGGTARWASGLSVNDFLKRSSLIALDRDGLAALAPISGCSPTRKGCRRTASASTYDWMTPREETRHERRGTIACPVAGNDLRGGTPRPSCTSLRAPDSRSDRPDPTMPSCW